jgi:hypothetical protein
LIVVAGGPSRANGDPPLPAGTAYEDLRLYTTSVIAASGSQTFRVDPEHVFDHQELPGRISAMTLRRPTQFWAVTSRNDFYFVGPRGPELVPSDKGPTGVSTIATSLPPTDDLFAGGIDSGLWRAEGFATKERLEWIRLLKTPITSLVVDPHDPERVLAGTPGGVLLSTNRGESWRFTEFRDSVSGLTSDGRQFFAMSKRTLYRSLDGEKSWVPFPIFSPSP